MAKKKRHTPRGKAKSTAKTNNPFDAVGNKRKRPVALNHRAKGAVRDVGRSRAKGDERRRRGLLKDLARETRENVFEDQRLGEGLDEDDAMLLRFQRERTKRTRTSRRGLDEELTHGGKPLSDAAISAAFFGDEGEDRRAKESVQEHFGTGDDYEKRDFVGDMIAQTKQEREERQAANEQLARDREALDASFGDLAQSLAFRANKPDRNDDDDDYDRDLRALATERRVKATDPSIAPSEAARARLDALKRREAQRSSRIEGRKAEQTNKDPHDPWNRDPSDPWYGIIKPEGYSSSEDEVVEEEEEDEIPYVFDACPSTSDELRELVRSVSATSEADIGRVVRRVACCHAPALGDVAKYEGFIRALCGALRDAGDDLCRGSGASNEVEALAHTLPSVLLALEPERAAECIEEALIDEDMSPGACLALRVVLKEESLLCSADDEAPRLAYRSIVKLAQSLDEDRAPKTCGEVGVGLLRCLTVMEAAGINAEGRTWWVPEAFAFLQTVLNDIEKCGLAAACAWRGQVPPQIAIEDLLQDTSSMRCASLIAGAASLAVEAVAFTVSDANRGAASAFVDPLVQAATAARELLAARGAAPALLKTLDACLASLNSVDAAEPDADVIITAPETLEPRLEAHTIGSKLTEKTPKGELKKLKRQVRKEHRGAVRELRRDAEFLRAERSRRKAGDRGSKQDERQANYAWLQTQAQNGWSGK